MMAKAKLTKQAVKYIVKLYNSETENYTFLELKNKVLEKFDIDVSLQAVQQNYHKYMEEIEGKPISEVLKNNPVRNKAVVDTQKEDEVRPKPKSSPPNIFEAFGDKKRAVNTSSKQYLDTDELNITSNEIQNLLKADK